MNLYIYCCNNPIIFIDPSGNRFNNERHLLEQDKSYGPNNLERYSKGGNGLYVEFDGKNLNVTINVAFIGDPLIELEDSGKSLKELAIEGLESWNGNYSVLGSDVSMNVTVNDVTGIHDTGFGIVNIHLIHEAKTSHATAFPKPWFVDSEREMYIYTTEKYGSDIKASDVFRNTVTHEMGHLLGVGDAYKYENNPVAPITTYTPKTMAMRMIDSGQQVVDLEVAMVYEAWRSNSWQLFTSRCVRNSQGQVVFKSRSPVISCYGGN